VSGRAFLAGVLAAVLIGAAVGLDGYTFLYAKGYSYLTDNPRACANCHRTRWWP
jgi:cytochrome c nitrite reductase small subunit